MDQKPVTATLFADKFGDSQECDFAYIAPISSPARSVIVSVSVTMSEIINDLVSAQCPVSLQYHHQYDQGPQLLPGGQDQDQDDDLRISDEQECVVIRHSDICTACKYISVSSPE